jgi:hypothetical protein
VQVQDDPRALSAGRGQRARAERRVEVVRVDDACARAPNRTHHRIGVVAAAQQMSCGRRGRGRPRVALEHLDRLAEVLAHEPGEVADRALLPALGAVAVVDEEDHGAHESARARRPALPQT